MESTDNNQSNRGKPSGGGGGGGGEEVDEEERLPTHIRLSKLINNRDMIQGEPLSTQEALVRLHDSINEEVIRMKNEYAKRRLVSWIRESISFKSELSKMRWPSVVFMSAQAIAHFIVAFLLNVENLATKWVGFQGFLLFLLLLFNLTVNLWDTQLRFKELLMKAEQIRELVWHCSQDKHLISKWRRHNWKSTNSRTLFIPKSPCVHQTLTYRDESCLNLPDYLLVKGDIIHLYPGDRAPCDCISLATIDGYNSCYQESNVDRVILNDGDVFQPVNIRGREAKGVQENSRPYKLGGDSDVSGHAKLKKANKGTDFLVATTPYINSLRISLQRSHKRPVNSIEKECFIVSRKYFETYVIPLVFILSTIVTAIHYAYLDLTDSDHQFKTISIVHLLLRPSLTIMPFLPWMFPCFWMAVNAYGSARLLCCADAQRNRLADQKRNLDIDSPGWSKFDSGRPNEATKVDNLLATPTAAGSSDQNKHEDDDLHELRNSVKFSSIFRLFTDLIFGKGGHVWRSSSLLQVLGCLTSLCCIDNVGILSWPNPTHEKVFVLTRSTEDKPRHLVEPANHSDDASTQNGTPIVTNFGDSNNQTLISFEEDNLKNIVSSSLHDHDQRNNNDHPATKHTTYTHPSGKAEVFDISQSFNPFRGGTETLIHHATLLQFDDINWTRHIDNLKPLGLAIMMNNCCDKSFGDYFRFYKHISYESSLRCNLTPVFERRCLCALSELIGFSRSAVKNYEYINQIGMYKLADNGIVEKGKLISSSETTTRLKMPFPNIVCNIHRDTISGSYQVFSQGTAEVILDACVEYWDGSQLVPLDDLVRKRIKDFYHRTSLTSYCSAFSYTPLLDAHNLGDHYVVLPSESSKLSLRMKKLTNQLDDEILQKQFITLQPNKQSAQTSAAQLFDESNLSSQDNLQISSLNSSLIQMNYPNSNHEFFIASPPKPTIRVLRRHLSLESVRNCDKKIKIPHLNQSYAVGKNHKLAAVLDELTDQVFVGMVANQYQACPDFVSLVEQLEHACIRFVHFSKENELRSRVFSEKMGLESGWNCHISLQSDKECGGSDKCVVNTSRLSQDNGQSSEKLTFKPSIRVSNLLTGNTKSHLTRKTPVESIDSNDVESKKNGSISSGERTLYSWRSLPSLVMQINAKLFSKHNPLKQMGESKRGSLHDEHNESSGDEQYQIDDNKLTGTDEVDSNNSIRDEGFEALAFDMSNRAKLPKGIENIRPHLETVDNIPLQVSLFTDCTPASSKEMIEIMQDYGEIVCVIGSSSSRLNTAIFLQANASIAVEPLVPQSCAKSGVPGRRSRSRSRSHKNRSKSIRKQRSGREIGTAHEVGGHIEDDSRLGFTAIQMSQRPSNPRDRLGIGPTATETNANGRITQRRRKISSSSESSRNQSDSEASSSDKRSSSSSSTSSRSSTSSSCGTSFSSSSSPGVDDSYDNHGRGRARRRSSSSQRRRMKKSNESLASVSSKSSGLALELPEPSALASKLASLPCSYSYNRRDQINLYSLILEARDFTFKMKNTFVCMICFALSISSAQFLASILFLPPMLSSGLTIWLTVVVVPLMSFSLMGTSMDSQVMKLAVGKNLQLKPENITFFVVCYLIKFIPSIIVVVLNFGLIIAHSCKLTGFGSSSLGPCWMFTYVQHGNTTSAFENNEDLLWSSHLLTAQVSAAFLIVLYFVVISSGFVHRSHLIWERSPTRNHLWIVISLLLIIGQICYNQLVLEVNLDSSKIPYEFLASLPLHIWLVSFMWPVLVIGINLLVKRAEIKATIRQQRRARFDFNTKLGMNSPF